MRTGLHGLNVLVDLLSCLGSVEVLEARHLREGRAWGTESEHAERALPGV